MLLTTRRKIALARLAQQVVLAGRRVLGQGTTAVARRGGIRWQLDLAEGIDFSIYLLGAFEPETVEAYRRLVPAGASVVDIGANIGAHTLPLAAAVGEGGQVIAIEPTDFAFAKLQANSRLNPALEARIRACQAFLVDRPEETAPAMIYASWPLDRADDTHALHGGRLKSAQGARSLTLDALLAELGVARVDFMKVDIDGFECRMLRGAGETLRSRRPLILMELSPHQLDEQEGLEALLSLLAGAGYRLERLNGAVLPMDGPALRAMIPLGAGMNVLARPA